MRCFYSTWPPYEAATQKRHQQHHHHLSLSLSQNLDRDPTKISLCKIFYCKLSCLCIEFSKKLIYFIIFPAKKSLLGLFLCAFSSSGFISISHIGLGVFYSNPTKIERRVSELETKLLVWLI